MLDNRADLHLHTKYSDGAFSPFEIIDLAVSKGFRGISITDHDTIDGYLEAEPYAREKGIELIPGVELSSASEEGEVHILGYFIDPGNKELYDKLYNIAQKRIERAEKIIRKLNKHGLEISIDDVDTAGRIMGRPHIASALVKKKLVQNFYEAFDLYLGTGKSAYIPNYSLRPEEAVEVIRKAGGYAFIAHPVLTSESNLEDLLKSGIDGIEAVHPAHNRTKTRNFKKLALQKALFVSGGSDFHGGSRRDFNNLGKYHIPWSSVEILKKSRKLRQS